ncbi:MAG: hypothetical protein WBD02_05055 [Acidimicrobiia bacterium]
MAKPSSTESDASRVRVQPERRQQPDLAKLAAALIELATEQLNNTDTTTATEPAAADNNAPAPPRRRRSNAAHRRGGRAA